MSKRLPVQTKIIPPLHAAFGASEALDRADHLNDLYAAHWPTVMGLADSAGVSSSVRPGRSRTRNKSELDDKVKQPNAEVRKKSPPARKAPARGRYVDEYARPAR